MKALARRFVQNLVQRVLVQLPPLRFCVRPGPRFRRFKHAIEAAQYGHGEHNALVLGRAVRPPEQIGYLPDKVGEISMIGHVLKRSTVDPHVQ